MKHKDEERVGIAELERYCVPVRAIATIEESLGIIYLDQLLDVPIRQLLSVQWLGPRNLALLLVGLRCWMTGAPFTKSIADCLTFGNDEGPGE